MKTADFAFVVHSRDRTDLPRKFPWTRFLPVKLLDKLTKRLPPFVVSRITGLITERGKESMGLVIGIPMTAKQLLEHRETARKRILSAVRLARSRGAVYIGLGAMTASLSRGGQDIVENIPDVYITTGRTYTIKNITEYISYCLKRFNLHEDKIKVGIVGAAGGIGSGVAVSLACNGFKKFVLIDLERKLTHLKRHIEDLEKHAPDLTIETSHQVGAVNSCNIIIAATSAPEVVVKSEDVSPGTIIINDAQPSDVSPEIIKTRKDVLVIEGGVLHAPPIDCHFNFGLAHRNDVFSCLAETLWLAYRCINSHHSMGTFDQSLHSKIAEDSVKLGFGITRPQNDGGYVDEKYLDEFAKIIKTVGA